LRNMGDSGHRHNGRYLEGCSILKPRFVLNFRPDIT
jgi:hypothetical protein